MIDDAVFRAMQLNHSECTIVYLDPILVQSASLEEQEHNQRAKVCT